MSELFNSEGVIPIMKEWGGFSINLRTGGTTSRNTNREFSEKIGEVKNSDIEPLIRQEKGDFTFINISKITLSEDLSYDIETENEHGLIREWNYHISYGYSNGYGMGGSNLKLSKSEFEQKIREIKLNNLLK